MRNVRVTAAACIVLAVFLGSGRLARAQGVVDQVPADAWVVFKVNNLQQTSDKVKNWAEALGLAQMSPEMADPLGALEEKLQLKEGLDRSGEVAFVMLNPDANGGPDKSMLILVPVSDYKAFVGNFEGAKAQGPITTFKAKDSDQDVFVTNWGKYAAMSPSRQVIAKKPTQGLKLQGLIAKEAASKDAVLYANIPAMRAKALPQLQKARQQMMEAMRGGFGGQAAPPEEPEPLTEPEGENTEEAPGAEAGGVNQGAFLAPAAAPRPAPARRAPPAERADQEEAATTDDAAGDDVAAGDEAVSDDAEPASNSRRGERQPAGRQPAGRQPANRQPTGRQPAGAAADPDDAGADAGDDAGAGADAGNAGGGDAEKFMPVMEAFLNVYFNAAEQFLTDTQGAAISFNLDDDGLAATGMAEFTPDSYLGKVAKGLKNTDANLMAGLPDRKYFAFGGATLDSKVIAQVMKDAIDPISKQLAGTGPEGQQIAKSLDAWSANVAAMKGMSFGYVVPTGALGQDSIIQAVAVATGDAAAIQRTTRQALEGYGGLFRMMPAQGGQMGFESQPGAKTVGGVKLDTYKFNLEMAGDDPGAAQAQQMLGFIYGPAGMSGVHGVVNKNTYVMVQGGNEKLIADAVAAAKNPQDKLSQMQNVKMVAGKLPPNRVLVEYVALDQIISSGVKYAQGFGLPVKMQLPANLPPIGMAVASEGAAIRVDGFLPTQLVQSVVAAGMQAYMQMQGGPGDAGGPDGL